MTANEIAIIMRALGRVESKLDSHDRTLTELDGKVDTLFEAALLARGARVSWLRWAGRVGALLLIVAALTTAGTGVVVYYNNTTHPPSSQPRVVVVKP